MTDRRKNYSYGLGKSSLERFSYSQTTLPLWSVTFSQYFFDSSPIRHLILIGNVNLTYNIHSRRTLPPQFSTNLWRKETGTGFDIKKTFISTSRKTHEAWGWLPGCISRLCFFSSQALTSRPWPNIITICSSEKGKYWRKTHRVIQKEWQKRNSMGKSFHENWVFTAFQN